MELRLICVDFIPEDIEEGVLYLSDEFETSIHLCPCGCKEQIVMPFGRNFASWKMEWTSDDTVTFEPSIGNWSLPCHSHYWIRDNKIIWC